MCGQRDLRGTYVMRCRTASTYSIGNRRSRNALQERPVRELVTAFAYGPLKWQPAHCILDNIGIGFAGNAGMGII